jgi:hypothetical protein
VCKDDKGRMKGFAHVDDGMFSGQRKFIYEFIGELKGKLMIEDPVYLEKAGDTGKMLQRKITLTQKGF